MMLTLAACGGGGGGGGETVSQPAGSSSQSNSAGIGTRTGATQSADVFGSLFGTDAKGVGGVVRSQSTSPQAFIGAFYGNR